MAAVATTRTARLQVNIYMLGLKLTINFNGGLVFPNFATKATFIYMHTGIDSEIL